jgi:hypothetical protein
MPCTKSLLRRTTISLVLASELTIAFSLTATIPPGTAKALHESGKRLITQQARKQSTPPPSHRNLGGSTGEEQHNPTACPQDATDAATNLPLTALSPTTGPGLTLEAHPTFLIYVPRTTAETAEFSLSTREGRGVYRTTINLTNTPDIISVTVPEQAQPVEVGRPYMWVFAVICNPNRRMSDQFVMSNIQRTELAPVRLRQIEQTPIRQRIALYQEDGIWYDALALLFELKRSQPNAPEINTAWREFLQSGGVDSRININSADPR